MVGATRFWQTGPVTGTRLRLQEQPFGPWLLAAVAVGLAAYGVYQWMRATYGRVS